MVIDSYGKYTFFFFFGADSNDTKLDTATKAHEYSHTSQGQEECSYVVFQVVVT